MPPSAGAFVREFAPVSGAVRFLRDSQPDGTARALSVDSAPVSLEAGAGTSRFVLLVFHESDGGVESRPLPASGRVSIGRAADNDIVLADGAVSRYHAVLHVADAVQIEDLGSGNGTRIFDWRTPRAHSGDDTERAGMTDTRIAVRRPVPLSPGHVVQIGSALLVVQRATSTSSVRRVWTHDYFEARLEEECVRAARRRGSFAVIGIRTDSAPVAESERALARALGPEDVLATYAENGYEVLVADPTTVSAVEQAIARELAAEKITASVVVARYPADGRSADALLARVCTSGEVEPEADVGAPVLVDPAMQRLYRLAERMAASTISVLITGETGTGKELLAEALHRRSPRRDQPFLRLNCAALTETLLESELFGHERGAFTGATAAKAGLLEGATGGSVFLDEIGELPLSVQAKLLRVLEEGAVLRVGGTKPRPVNVRFIAATNRDLEREVAAGRFRGDLFFRINGVCLVIPALRERPLEIEALARYFIRESSRRNHRQFEPALGADALDLMQRYPWPGNVRELRNVVERALLLCNDREINAEHLPLEKMRTGRWTLADDEPERPQEPAYPLEPTLPPPSSAPHSPQRLREMLADAERDRIVRALEACGGNQTRAAKMLGMARGTLILRMQEFNLPRPRK